MRPGTSRVAVVALLFVSAAVPAGSSRTADASSTATVQARARRVERRIRATHHPDTGGTRRRPARATTAPLPCGDALGFQVLLDRNGFSPGQIDGHLGENALHAIAAVQQARGLPVTGEADCATWQALGGDAETPLLQMYEVTPTDVKGPFTPRIPDDLVQQGQLPALEYMSALEEIAERFHTSPDALRSLNPRARFTDGERIQVPGVAPFDPTVKPAHDDSLRDITITVSKDESALRVTRGDGALIFFAPVSSGSIHDPLPPGNWTVTSVDWMPVFHYNPELFWDAKPTNSKVTIKAGPNNPVGVVWIGLDLEHYGLHGTPEPSRIGHTQSHGCVRLTNWDAAHVAAMVEKGTSVVFR